MLMLSNFLVTVWSRFLRWSLVEILNLNLFSHNFEVDFWSQLWGWELNKILKLEFGRDFEPEFGQDIEAKFWSRFWRWCLSIQEAEFRSRFWSWRLVKILKLKFGRDSETEFWCFLNAVTLVKELTVVSVVPLTMSLYFARFYWFLLKYQAQLDNILRDPSLLDPYQYIQTVLNLRGVSTLIVRIMTVTVSQYWGYDM